MAATKTHIEVEGVTLAYGDFVIQHDLTFRIRRGDVFIIMGGSGCGKSAVMRSFTGLLEPKTGRIFYDGISFWEAPADERANTMRRFGVMYQSGALALTVIAILVFSSGALFKPKTEAITYFPGTVQGLTVGARVEFQGVQIGEVTDIKLDYRPEQQQFSIPVYYDVWPESVRFQGERPDEIEGVPPASVSRRKAGAARPVGEREPGDRAVHGGAELSAGDAC